MKKEIVEKEKKSIIEILFGSEKAQGITIPILTIIMSLVVGGIVMIAMGKSPILAYKSLLQGAGVLPKEVYAGSKSMFTDFMNTLDLLTPMIFAALAVALAFKGGMFSIGVSGQMLAGAYVATVLVGYNETLSPFIAKPLVILIGFIVGGLVGALIGFLKQKFNINEVVSAIMINYILLYTIGFFITKNNIDPISRQSTAITEASRLTLVNTQIGDVRANIPLGIGIAILASIGVYFLLNKTKLGYEIKSIGSNKNAAKYAGINVPKNTILTMFLSGGLAGLAGVFLYMGYFASIQPKVLSPMGFDAIAVALLGNSNPIAIIFSSLLVTIISTGSSYISSKAGVEQEIAQVITGIILLFSACTVYIKYLINKKRDENVTLKKAKGKGEEK